MATLRELCKRVKATVTYGAKLAWDKQSDWQQQANGWSVQLRYKGRRATFDFWTGQGISDDPTAEDVLECLLSDAQGGEQTFEEFCGEFGYDQDSRKAEAIWKACQAMSVKVRRLLGDDYESFLYADR